VVQIYIMVYVGLFEVRIRVYVYFEFSLLFHGLVVIHFHVKKKMVQRDGLHVNGGVVNLMMHRTTTILPNISRKLKILVYNESKMRFILFSLLSVDLLVLIQDNFGINVFQGLFNLFNELN
jgi:hypothetical protein